MMPMMITDSPAARTEEASTLRALLHAACLSPFGPLAALRDRVATQVMGVAPDLYVYNRATFTAMTSRICSQFPRRVPVTSGRCITAMTDRMAAHTRTSGVSEPSLSLSPPQYSDVVHNHTSPPLPLGNFAPMDRSQSNDMTFRTYDLNDAYDSMYHTSSRPVQDRDAHVPWTSVIGTTVVRLILIIMAAFIIQLMINIRAVFQTHQGES